VPYVRTAKTASGAMAVQVVWSSRRGSREIEHIGSGELEPVKVPHVIEEPLQPV
jgi:hypothetical protein